MTRTITAASRLRYWIGALIVFLIEVAIARGIIPGAFVRSSLGDVLVIVLIYCVIRGSVRWPDGRVALLSFSLGVLVEFLQYLQLADRLGLRPGSIGYIILGNTFSGSDLLMYAIGAVTALGLDRIFVQPGQTERIA